MHRRAHDSTNPTSNKQTSDVTVLRKARQEKFVLCAALSAIALSLIGITGTLILYGLRSHQMIVDVSSVPAPIACVICSKLVRISSKDSKPDPLISKLSTLVENGVQMCCARDSEQMSTLLELTMRRQEPDRDPLPEFDPKHFTFSSVSAHKRLYLPPVNKTLEAPLFNKSALVVTKFKQHNDHLVEHVRGVEVMDEGLKVLHSGQYMIYSNIHFRPDSALPCRKFEFQVWGHFVYRFSYGNPAGSGCIMKTSHTCCDHCTRDDETSFTSGVFSLLAGDVIRVEVSGHGLVYFGKQSSFAGLMMLGGATSGN